MNIWYITAPRTWLYEEDKPMSEYTMHFENGYSARVVITERGKTVFLLANGEPVPYGPMPIKTFCLSFNDVVDTLQKIRELPNRV